MKKRKAQTLNDFHPDAVNAVGKFMFQMSYDEKKTKALSGFPLPKIRAIKNAILEAVKSEDTERLRKTIVTAVKRVMLKEDKP